MLAAILCRIVSLPYPLSNLAMSTRCQLVVLIKTEYTVTLLRSGNTKS